MSRHSSFGKSIGTAQKRNVLKRFERIDVLKKLGRYNPDETNQKKRKIPNIMNGIKQLARKEKTLFKNSDLWISEEHAILTGYTYVNYPIEPVN